MDNRKYRLLRINGKKLMGRGRYAKAKGEALLVDFFRDKDFFIYSGNEGYDEANENAVIRQLAIEIFYRHRGGEKLKTHLPSNEEEVLALLDMEKFDKGIDRAEIEREIRDSLVYVNFLDSDVDELPEDSSFESVVNEGFSIAFGNKIRHYRVFLKSNSMSKKGMISYIDEEYYASLLSRVMLGYDQEENKLRKFNISKFYAYTGLAMTDGYSIDNKSLLDEEKVVVVSTGYIYSPEIPIYTRLNYDEYENLLLEALLAKVHDRFLAEYEEKKELLGEIGKSAFNNVDREYFSGIGRPNPSSLGYKLYSDVLRILRAFGPYPVSEARKLFNHLGSHLTFENFLDCFSLLNSGLVSLLGIKMTSFKKEISSKTVLLRHHKKKLTDPFDGEGLILPSLGKSFRAELGLNNVPDKRKVASFQIRLPFIKGMVHEANFPLFFARHDEAFIDVRGVGEGIFNTYDELALALGIDRNKNIKHFAIKDKIGKKILDAFRVYRDIEKIEMILTPGQVKLSSFLADYSSKEHASPNTMKDYFGRVKALGYGLLISKANRLYDSSIGKAELNYQFLLTSGAWPKEKMKKAMFRGGTPNVDNFLLADYESSYLKEKGEELTIDKNNEFQVLAKANKEVINVPFVKEGILEEGKRKLSSYAFSHFPIKGERRILSSDLLYLLYSLIGKEEEYARSPSRLRLSEFYAPKVNIEGVDDTLFIPRHEHPCSICRNPHLTKNETVLSYPYKVQEKEERSDYFASLTNICMINVASMSHSRLGGADFDGDEVLIIDDDDYNEGVYEQFVHNEEGGFVMEGREKNLFVPLYETIDIPSFKGELNSDISSFSILTSICLRNTFSSSVGKYSNNGSASSIIEEMYPGSGFFKEYAVNWTITVGLEIDKAKTGVAPSSPKGVPTEYTPLFKRVKHLLRHYEDYASRLYNPLLSRANKEDETSGVSLKMALSIASETYKGLSEEFLVKAGQPVSLLSLLDVDEENRYEKEKERALLHLKEGTFAKNSEVLERLLIELVSYEKSLIHIGKGRDNAKFDKMLKQILRLKLGEGWAPIYDELVSSYSDNGFTVLNPSLLYNWGIESRGEHEEKLRKYGAKENDIPILSDSVSLGYRLFPTLIHLFGDNEDGELYADRFSSFLGTRDALGYDDETLFRKSKEIKEAEVSLIKRLFPSLYELKLIEKDEGKRKEIHEGLGLLRDYLIEKKDEDLVTSYKKLSTLSKTNIGEEEYSSLARAIANECLWSGEEAKKYLRTLFPKAIHIHYYFSEELRGRREAYNGKWKDLKRELVKENLEKIGREFFGDDCLEATYLLVKGLVKEGFIEEVTLYECCSERVYRALERR